MSAYLRLSDTMRAELSESSGQLYLIGEHGLIAIFEPFRYNIVMTGAYELAIDIENISTILIDEIKQVQ